MKRNIIAAAVAALAAVSLSACQATEEAATKAEPSSKGCMFHENNVDNEYCESTVDYRGRDLHCIVGEAYLAVTYSCDYDRFYRENPDLVEAGAPTQPQS